VDQMDPDLDPDLQHCCELIFYNVENSQFISTNLGCVFDPLTFLHRAFRALHTRIICLVRKLPVLYFYVSLPYIPVLKECVTRWIFFVDLKIFISTGIFCMCAGGF
jgi:hypothetical protein